MLSCPSLRLARRVSCAAVAAAFGAAAFAQPSGLTILHGNAVVEQAGSVTRITTSNGAGTRHSAFDWRSFSVPSGTTTHFQQPAVDSTSINRVLGNNPSEIFGTLSSNGRLVLVNPAGIAVGQQGLVDTAGFTASTLGMTAADAIAGTLRFGGQGALADFEAGSSQGIRVRGQVLARNGDVVLIGPELEIDSGAIAEANAGDVVLAAGRTVEITGRGVEGIRMELRAPDDQALNLGTLRGDSVAIFAGQLRHRGLIQARAATTSGGKVILQAVTDAELEGGTEASTSLRGGTVLVSGERLVLKGAAVIDVSHANGGGEIRLEGSERLDGDQGVVLKADATLSGPAGTVTLASPRVDFRGTIITASAGTGGGTGSGGDDDDEDDDDDGSGGGGSGSSGSNGGSGGSSASSGNPGNGGNSGSSGNAQAPGQAQPRPLQAALRETRKQSDSYLRQTLVALSSEPEDRYKRKVVIDAVRCTVTR